MRTASLLLALLALALLGALGARRGVHAEPGELDAAFGAGGKVFSDLGGDDAAYAVTVQADGRIVVAGTSDSGMAVHGFALARYLPDGNLDPAFGDGGRVVRPIGAGEAAAYAVAVLPDGAILAAGFAERDGRRAFALARLGEDGSPDPAFGEGGAAITHMTAGNDVARAVAVGPDGRIVVAGLAGGEFAMARYLPGGVIDSAFGRGGSITSNFAGASGALAIAVQSDGQILVAGSSWRGATVAAAPSPTLPPGVVGVSSVPPVNVDTTARDIVLSRYTATGGVDTGFGAGGRIVITAGFDRHAASALAVQPGGTILATGYFASGNANLLARARFTPAGRLDSGFGSDGAQRTIVDAAGDSTFFALAPQPDGNTVLAGYAWNGNDYDFALARYQGSSLPDPPPPAPTPGPTAIRPVTAGFASVDIAPIANHPLNWLTSVPNGSITLGGIPFTIRTGDRAIFLTAQRFREEFPVEGKLQADIESPAAVHVLLTGGYVLPELRDRKIGEIVLTFRSGAAIVAPIVVWQNIREGWQYDASPALMGPPPDGTVWSNVWVEPQDRMGAARAFLDLVSIPVPRQYASDTLTAITFRDTSGTTAGSIDPSLAITAVTVEVGGR